MVQQPLSVPDSQAELSNRLVLAVPKKGRLYDKVMQLLSGADIQFSRKNRLDVALSTNQNVAIVFLPASDIPRFVSDGIVDLGITGQDVVLEAKADVDQVLELGFGQCDLCVQVPESSGITDPRQLVGKRIATSFESAAGEYFGQLDSQVADSVQPGKGKVPRTTISFISGSVEVACALGLADGIVDLVESGETMRAAGLIRIHTLIKSQAVVIANKRNLHPELASKIIARIRGVILAQRYVYCNYNIPRSKLAAAISITPGRKAPTVSPLDASDWCAVSVAIEKKEVAEKMDELQTIGATDILVFGINNCRE